METTTAQKETLWRNSNFLRLWTSETISQFGSQFTGLALPLTAIIILGAKSVEVGILNFAGSVPWLLFGLIAGVWIDRHRKQRIMVTSNLLRGSILALIPITAVLGVITKLGLPFSLRDKLLRRIPTSLLRHHIPILSALSCAQGPAGRRKP